ncbi:MAG: exosortase-associated EpsI family protein [Gemmataceae bacterium]
MFRILCIFTALTTVIGTGLVHGYWTGRWETDSERERAAMPLDDIALNLGDWQGADREPTSRAPEPMLGYLHRAYKNRKTGAVVYVSLVYGRHGPVSIHTPDVCYDASGFRVGQRSPFTAPGTAAELFTADAVKKRSDNQTVQRIFWSWNAGGRWQVADSPRLAFARYPMLYKLYLVREMNAVGEPLDDDPCVDLLRLLLPEMQRVLGFRPT